MNFHISSSAASLAILAAATLTPALIQPAYAQAPHPKKASTVLAPHPKKASTVLAQKATTVGSVVNKKYIGHVEAIDNVAVVARVSGNIDSTQFKEGSIVKKGDLLFEIEDTRYTAALESKQAEKQQLEAKLKYAKDSYDRYNKLLSSKSVSKDTVENAKSAMLALQAQLMAADAAITLAKDDLMYTKVTAPITGRTGRVKYSTGNYVTPASGTLVTITGTEEVYVRFPLSERDYIFLFGNRENIRNNANIELTLANGKVYPDAGRVYMTDNEVKTTTGTMNVWAKFSNKDDVLIPGGVVTVTLSKKNVDTYPAANISSVMHDSHKSYVYVLNKDNVVERRDVTLGNIVGNMQCFTSGVNEGDTVIIDGMHKVDAGAKATPVFEQTQSAK